MSALSDVDAQAVWRLEAFFGQVCPSSVKEDARVALPRGSRDEHVSPDARFRGDVDPVALAADGQLLDEDGIPVSMFVKLLECDFQSLAPASPYVPRDGREGASPAAPSVPVSSASQLVHVHIRHAPLQPVQFSTIPLPSGLSSGYFSQ